MDRHDVLIGLAGMILGALSALAGAWALVVILLSFERLVP